MNKIITPQVPFAEEKLAKAAKERKDADAAIAEEARKKLAEQFAETEKKINEVEIKPTFRQVLIEPYSEDPYMFVVKNGILFTDKAEHLSAETGLMESDTKYIILGKVIDVAADCEYIRPGDDIYCMARNTVPCPFLQKGWKFIREESILCVIAKNAGKRLKMDYEKRYGAKATINSKK